MISVQGPAASARRLERAVGSSVFGADASGYHEARLDYPAELYVAIRARCGDRAGLSILEIGPGTGLATADLLKLAPVRLVAVEPDPALCAHLAATIDDGALHIVEGGFETAPIATMFDLACSAAAFHWLEPEPALARLRRLLRSGGCLALWWNVYRQPGIGDAFADAVTPLISRLELPPSEGLTGHYSLDVDLHRSQMVAAGFEDFAPFLFRRERRLDTAQVRALYASYSYIRSLPPPERESLLDDIAMLANDGFGGIVPNVTLTPLYLASAPAA